MQKGDILVELDPASADLQRLRQDAAQLNQYIIRHERLMALIQNSKDPQAQQTEPALTPLQERLLHTQWLEYTEASQTLNKELSKLQAQGDP